MKRKILTLLLVFALAAVFAGCGKGSKEESAEDTSLKDIQEAGVLRVGMCPEYPPFESINASGEIEGFDADLAKAIGEKLGVDVEFVNTPYEGLIAGLQNGDFDVIMSGMSPEEADESDKMLNVTDNYYAVDEVVLTKNKNIKTKEDLAGKDVGSHTGSTSEYAVDALIEEGINITSKPYNRHSEAFADLQNGNIDAQVVESTWANEKVTEDSGIVILEEPVSTINVAGVIGKDRAALTEAFNKALKELIESGDYDEIVAKWFS